MNLKAQSCVGIMMVVTNNVTSITIKVFTKMLTFADLGDLESQATLKATLKAVKGHKFQVISS